MTIPLSLRFQVLERDGFRCLFCGKAAPETELEIDHLQPRSKGGGDELENLATACRDCNRGKSDTEASLFVRSWRNLEGKFFHSYQLVGGKRHVQWQGRILQSMGDGYYMVDLFEWITGSRAFDGNQIVHMSRMATEGWSFYLTEEAMRDAYEYGGIKPTS